MRQVSKRKLKDTLVGYAFLLPSLFGFSLFIAYPIIRGFILSFTDSDGFNPARFIGIENYVKLLKTPVIRKSLLNNVKYMLMFVPGNLFMSLLISTLVFNIGRGSRFFKTVLFFPYITSSIAIAMVWKLLYLPDNGLINTVLRAIGVANPPMWLASTKTALISVVIVAVWQSIGLNMLIFLSGMQCIPQELYDVGLLDGCTGWKKFRYITFPLLTPTVFFVLIMGIIGSFKVFDMVFQMTNGGPGDATTVMVYQIYKEGITRLHVGYASALAYVLFAIVLLITLIQFKLQKHWVYYGEE